MAHYTADKYIFISLFITVRTIIVLVLLRFIAADRDDGNTTKLIVELLSSGDFEMDKLCSLLKTELKNRPDVSEIIGDVLPRIITDTARHGLCEALLKTNVEPQVVCKQIYLPWVNEIFESTALNIN